MFAVRFLLAFHPCNYILGSSVYRLAVRDSSIAKCRSRLLTAVERREKVARDSRCVVYIVSIKQAQLDTVSVNPCNLSLSKSEFAARLEGLKAVSTSSSSSSSVICQTTGLKPLPKRFLHIVRSRASSFN